MTKTIYEPTPRAKEIYACVANANKSLNRPISYSEICADIGKCGTATVKALVDNGYLVVADEHDVICPCCGAKKKAVKFYGLGSKAI